MPDYAETKNNMQTKKRTSKTMLALGDCNTGSVEKYNNLNIFDRLKCRLANQDIEVDIDNLGKAMYTTREGVHLTHEMSKPYDYAVLNFGLVDSWVTSIPDWYVLYYPSHPA